jgi:high-affinity iron transporter
MVAPLSLEKRRVRALPLAGLALGALLVAALLIWQALTAAGSPDPTLPHTGRPQAILDIAVLVFREGLECVLVLSAITAGLMGTNQRYRLPIGLGAGVGALATLLTWFIAVAVLDDLTHSLSVLAVQAWTGLLAIVVLLVVMNWFFHKVYWTGWIALHNRRKRSLLQEATAPGASRRRLFLGLGLLGCASFYREGFEVVLFLQSYRLQMGTDIVCAGALLGLLCSGIVGVLTFVGHHRLPYKKMLVLTGLLLAGVLFVMIGEQAQEMQLAGWIGTTTIPWLRWLPGWAGTWFALFPTWQTLCAQVLGLLLVVGVYGLARNQAVVLPKKRGVPAFALREEPPADEMSDNTVSAIG